MRKLTGDDLAKLTGSTVAEYRIERARVKRGSFTDTDHYGILLGKSDRSHYVTWQFH
jgi:hypothetical protein